MTDKIYSADGIDSEHIAFIKEIYMKVMTGNAWDSHEVITDIGYMCQKHLAEHEQTQQSEAQPECPGCLAAKE